MREHSPEHLREILDRLYNSESRRILTTFIRLLGDFDVAEDALHDAFAIELNRAVAVAMHDGPQAGLDLIDAILARGDLADYHLAHAARAELCRRLGHIEEARVSYKRARALTPQGPEQRFLEEQIKKLG